MSRMRTGTSTRASPSYSKSGHDTLPRVVRTLDDENLPFSGLRLARATLDDVFFKATGHRIEPGDQAGQQAQGGPA